MPGHRVSRGRARAVSAIAASFAAVVWITWPQSPASGDSHAAPRSSRLDLDARLLWKGTGSCASGPCHGGPVSSGVPGGEYGLFADRDPHGQAYAVLTTERSRRIASLYRGQDVQAETDTLCLSCHVRPGVGQSPQSLEYAMEDGVGCESCHGAAQNWLALHTTAPWKLYTPEQKAAYGLVPLTDLVTRAERCAVCHVGSPEAEVNHDLIAAGHPRMNFEFASFHALYPKHWDTRHDKATAPDFEARAWLIGQVASAKGALELLASRATRASETPAHGPSPTPWPELSEYGCFACHQNLVGPEQVDETYVRPSGLRSGLPPWNTWYLPMLRAGLPPVLGVEPLSECPDLARLNEEMGKAIPEARTIADLASRAARDMDGWLQRLRYESLDPDRIRDLMKKFADRGEGAPANWDADAQLYLALAALFNAHDDLRPGSLDPKVRADLHAMRGVLQFQESPGATFDSPNRYTPGQFDGPLKDFLNSLSR